MKQFTHLYNSLGMLAMLCLTSCASDELNDTLLPAGKYPMTFATMMEGLTQTRANTAEGEWTMNDLIAVQIDGQVKQYTAAGSGKSATLQPIDANNTFYWQYANETKEVSAWYCGDGSTAAGQKYATQFPTTWTVQTNQSGNGYAESDLLYAMPQNIAYKDRDSKQLTFKHLPAKVVINLQKGEGLTVENIQSATVSIVNQETKSGTINAADGLVAPITTPSNKEIITNNVPDAPPADYQKSVQAIVVPQQVAKGTKFIKVSIGKGSAARNYYYTTKSDNEVNLEYGKQYTYNIIVTKKGLSMGSFSISQWIDMNIDDGTKIQDAIFCIKFSGDNLSNDTQFKGITKIAENVYNTTGGNSFSISYTSSNPAEIPEFSIEKGMATGRWVEISNNDNTTTYTYTCTNIRSDLWLNHVKNPAVGYYYYK